MDGTKIRKLIGYEDLADMPSQKLRPVVEAAFRMALGQIEEEARSPTHWESFQLLSALGCMLGGWDLAATNAVLLATADPSEIASGTAEDEKPLSTRALADLLDAMPPAKA